jgi:hypothetical protein
LPVSCRKLRLRVALLDVEEAQNPDDEDDGREKDSARGEDDRSNPEDDNACKSPPSMNRIAKAVESMGDEGDGVTDEVCQRAGWY